MGARNKKRQRLSLRALIVLVATLVWLVSEGVAFVNPRVNSEPGIGAAYMAVLAAAVTFPEIERFRRGKGDDDDDDGRDE